MKSESFTNHLAGEKSPYLLQHQNNPVDWYPWGEAAFQKAKKEDKPIFLSIGYSTCHWCHVMAHESFENEEIAKVMNENFINIKVDREERPDVDRVYMTFVQATTGGGGWPMSVFLTPDLKPFVGGTYFPPEDKFGRPGFKTVLERIARGWKDDREGIVNAGNQVVEQLREYAKNEPTDGSAIDAKVLDTALAQLTRTFDEEWGGFGEAPKFPRPSTLNFLFRMFARERAHAGDAAKSPALKMALRTLDKMADGGMHDHLGGGFHRYSVDRFWHIPHFEKMLYDQAQLTCSYLDAYLVATNSAAAGSNKTQINAARYGAIARDILGYVQRDMTDPKGGFYSAEDADSLLEHGKPEHAEGAFYVWTKAEIDELLGDGDAKIFDAFYGVEADGNAPAGSDPQGEFKGKNTLIQRMTLAEAAKQFGKSDTEINAVLERARTKLLARRNKRPRPHLDDKIITAWNGLMISAFARGAQVFGETTYLESAQRAAKFIRDEMWKDGHLRRSYREGAAEVKGFAEDYAFLIQGLLDLYEADFDVAWLQWAVELQAKMDATFADEKAGGYYSTSGDDPSVLLRMKEDYDGAEPSPNSVAALNLLRLAQITGDEKFDARARKTIATFGPQLSKLPTAVPQMLCALDASLVKPRQIVIAGPRDSDGTKKLLSIVRSRFMPNRIVLLADGAAGQAWLSQGLEFLKTVAPHDGKPQAYVCENFVCQLPTTDPKKLSEQLAH